MTEQQYNKAIVIKSYLTDLERLKNEFQEGANLRVEGSKYEHPLTQPKVIADIKVILLKGLTNRIKELEKEFEAI